MLNDIYFCVFHKVHNLDNLLEPYAYTLLYSLNSPEYWEWLATAPEQEIIEWAKEYEQLAQEVI